MKVIVHNTLSEKENVGFWLKVKVKLGKTVPKTWKKSRPDLESENL